MSKTYIFRYRRLDWPLIMKWFWVKHHVQGHMYQSEQDKMILHFDDGIQEIKHWTDCESKLGADWLSVQKNEDKKEEAGTE